MKKIVTIIVLFFTMALFGQYYNIEKLEKQCKRNDVEACITVGNAYYLSECNAKKALPFYVKACDLKDGNSCFVAAHLFEIVGQGKFFNSYIQRGCSLKHEQSCNVIRKNENAQK